MSSAPPPDPPAPKFVEHSASPIMRLGLTLTAAAVDAQDGSDFWVGGSAAMLGQDLAITARHVLDECGKRFGLRETGERTSQAAYSLLAVQVWCESHEDPNPVPIVYDVSQMKTAPVGDLALLRLVRRSGLPAGFDNRWSRFSLKPPRIGARAGAFGYHSGRIEWDRTKNQILQIRQPATSWGTVIDVHVSGRSNVPGPSFITDARYDGGMSGGPVLVDGVVHGIVTSSAVDSDGNPLFATVSMLAPLMAVEVDCVLPGETASRARTLHELARGGWLHIDGWEAVEVVRNDEGRAIGVRYDPEALSPRSSG